MRLAIQTVGVAAALSLALNIWLLWKFQDLSRQNANMTPGVPVQAKNAVVAAPGGGTTHQIRRAVAGEELEELSNRISNIEASLEALEQRLPEQAMARHRELSTEVQRLREGITQPEARGKEDWFWNSPAGEPGSTQSIPDGESYTVQSLACRSGWCRVEVLLDDTALDDPEAELELHQELSQAMGRDIELSFGDRTGNNQVIFIQSP